MTVTLVPYAASSRTYGPYSVKSFSFTPCGHHYEFIGAKDGANSIVAITADSEGIYMVSCQQEFSDVPLVEDRKRSDLKFNDLSGNPSSERTDQVTRQLLEFSEILDDKTTKDAFDKIFPDICPCCASALFHDAAIMIRELEAAMEGLK